MNTSRFGASLDCAALGATYPTLTKELSHSTCVKLHPDALFAFANHVPRCASLLDSVSHPAQQCIPALLPARATRVEPSMRPANS